MQKKKKKKQKEVGRNQNEVLWLKKLKIQFHGHMLLVILTLKILLEWKSNLKINAENQFKQSLELKK